MKTRKVTQVGILEIGEFSSRLIRIEQLQGFPLNAVGFTVTSMGNMVERSPYLIVTTEPWTIAYIDPIEVEVIDNTPDETKESEVDVSDADIEIPEPDVNPDEWKQLLLNDEQENVE